MVAADLLVEVPHGEGLGAPEDVDRGSECGQCVGQHISLDVQGAVLALAVRQ